MIAIFEIVLIGVGATLCIDLWAWLLRRSLGIRSLDYCLLGRWVLHMPSGTLVHANNAKSASKPRECAIGWIAHYSIGIGLAIVFIQVAPVGWLDRPTLVPAVAFGVATVVVPFFTMQPSFGLGFAASLAPSPWRARVKSVLTHTVFGLGLFIMAFVLSQAG